LSQSLKKGGANSESSNGKGFLRNGKGEKRTSTPIMKAIAAAQYEKPNILSGGEKNAPNSPRKNFMILIGVFL